MANTYCTATNWGKDFFTGEDRNDFYLSCHPGPGYGETPAGAMVWVVENNPAGIAWIDRVHGTAILKAEAQAMVDEKIEARQVRWDGLPAEEKAPANSYARPKKYLLT